MEERPDKLMGDVVSSIVEKVLMNVGLQTYNGVNEILEAHNLTFSDCYLYPDVLNLALKHLFEERYADVAGKIKDELVGLEGDNSRLAEFMERLGK